MKQLFITACCLTGVFAFAQTSRPDVIASAGGFANGPGFTNSYTIGEMAMVSTFSTGSFVLTQGFQQPNDGATGLAPVNENTEPFEAYPNPSNGQVFLAYDLTGNAEVTVEVYDLPGRLVLTEKSNRASGHQVHAVNLSSQSEGVYFIRLTIKTDGAVSTKTSKITITH